MRTKGNVYCCQCFYYILILLAIISVGIGCKNALGTSNGSFDFQYDAAFYFLQGINPYVESLNPTGLQEKFGLVEYYDVLEANQFPSCLLILTPFALFSPMIANVLFCIFNLLSTVGIAILLWELFGKERYSKKVFYGIVALMLIGTPWRNCIGNGQHTIFSFFFFLLAMYLSEKGRRILASIALTVSFFKYALTAPLAIFFLYKKKYFELTVAVFIHVVLTVVAMKLIGGSFLDMIIQPLQVSSKLAECGSYDLIAILKLGNIGLIVSAASFVGLSLLFFVNPLHLSEDQAFSLLCFFSLIITYHREYDYFILIVPLLVYGNKSKEHSDIIRALIWGVVTYFFIVSKIVIEISFDTYVRLMPVVAWGLYFVIVCAVFQNTVFFKNVSLSVNRLRKNK